MSALGQKRTSSAMVIYVRFRGLSGRSRAALCMSAYSHKRTFMHLKSDQVRGNLYRTRLRGFGPCGSDASIYGLQRRSYHFILVLIGHPSKNFAPTNIDRQFKRMVRIPPSHPQGSPELN